MRHGYVRDTWEFAGTREIEEKHTGRYGASGQSRIQKRKATPEDIRKQNRWKRERDLRRLIKWNFQPGDYWITFTYKKGERPSWERIKQDLHKLIRQVRIRYRKQGWELKYIYRMAIGKRGGPHVHMLINRKSNQQTGTDLLLSELWTRGRVHFQGLRETGGYKELAQYIAKPLEEWEPKPLKRYHVSRNLIRKEPKRKEIHRRNLRDRHGQMIYPKAPKGYFVDPESVRMGINPITGYAYRHYTLVKIKKGIREEGEHYVR